MIIKNNHGLSDAYAYVLLLLAFLLPIFFIPYISNSLINSKLWLLVLLAFITIFAYLIRSLLQKSWSIKWSAAHWALLVFTIAVFVSAIVSRPYPIDHFFTWGAAYIAFASIVFFGPSLLQQQKQLLFVRHLRLAFNVGAALLTILGILQLFGYGVGQFINHFSILKLPNNLSFSLTGSALIAIEFIATVLLANVFMGKEFLKSWANRVFVGFITIGLLIHLYAVLPNQVASFKTLPLSASLSIAKQSLTISKNALFGYGPSSYADAYSILKPMWLNNESYWQFVFDSAFNWPLTMVVSIGLLGTLAWLVFIWKTLESIFKNKTNADNPNFAEERFLLTFLVVTFLWQFIIPINILLLALQAIALAFFFNIHAKEKQIVSARSFLNLPISKSQKVKLAMLFVVSSVAILGSLFAFFEYGKNCVSAFLLYQSSQAASENRITVAYQKQQAARSLVPYSDALRRSYATMNLEIAVALSNKTNIDAAEQGQVLQLVNQAITEAKAATIINPYNYQNWLTLAEIYLQLVEAAPQAQQQAFDALAKAATYNPNNPDIRLRLGQLFYSQKQYAQAEIFFSQAIERKPDLASAYYSLAKAASANGDMTDAKNAFVTALTLLKSDSQDYQQVQTEYQNFQKQLEASQSAQSTNNQKTENKIDPTASSSANNSAPNLGYETEQQSDSSNLQKLLNQNETTETMIPQQAVTSEQDVVAP